jgi:signal peptidase I
MAKRPGKRPDETAAQHVEETPFEAAASICSVLVVGLFILTFLAKNFVIPSGSMKNTLLIGDHLVVDRITFAPPAKWMPLVHYRDPRRGDILVFIKPVPDDVNGEPKYLDLVKRCVGIPGDYIHLHEGIVYVNGVAQPLPPTGQMTPAAEPVFLDEFPAVPPISEPGNLIPESWEVDFHNHVTNGDLVVPPGEFFMMGDNRHNSADSRFWGFVPRENVVGRPLFNYWSFTATEAQMTQQGFGAQLAWMGHVALHFFTDTRWGRTFKHVK